MKKNKDKKKEKEKDKICGICKMKIITNNEEYCELIQYKKKGIFFKNGFYHVTCFRNRYIAHNKANELVDRTMKILEKAEGRFM